jgi:hypothetical protein
MVINRDPGVAYANEPAVLAAVRAEKPDGSFDGGLAAVFTLASLQPPPTVPADGLAGGPGRCRRPSDQRHRRTGLPARAGELAEAATKGRPNVWYGPRPARREPGLFGRAAGRRRRSIVVLSAKSPGLLSWAWLNPLTGACCPAAGLRSLALAP